MARATSAKGSVFSKMPLDFWGGGRPSGSLASNPKNDILLFADSLLDPERVQRAPVSQGGVWPILLFLRCSKSTFWLIGRWSVRCRLATQKNAAANKQKVNKREIPTS